MPLIIARILASLRALGPWLITLFGNMNLAGWAVAAAVPLAFIAIWLAVLKYVFGFLGTYLTEALATGQIFSVSIPTGGIYLINAMIPLQLFFTLTVSLLVFQAGAQSLLLVAIAATRALKGK